MSQTLREVSMDCSCSTNIAGTMPELPIEELGCYHRDHMRKGAVVQMSER